MSKIKDRLAEIQEEHQSDPQYVRYLFAHNFLQAYNETVNGPNTVELRDETIYEVADALLGIESLEE